MTFDISVVVHYHNTIFILKTQLINGRKFHFNPLEMLFLKVIQTISNDRFNGVAVEKLEKSKRDGLFEVPSSKHNNINWFRSLPATV